MAGDDLRLATLERPSDPVIGTVVNGRFRVEQELARGGMGRLYLARQAHVDRLVALKVVAADDEDPEGHGLRRFLLEASILAKIQHPNVVTLFDYGRIENSSVETHFIAMEYVHGESLSARLRARSSLSVPQTIAILRQVVSGLRETHARGVIHRDLKPSNIVLSTNDAGDVAKIVDFGVGKMVRDEDPLTRTGVLVGTPRYMAPEQFDGISSAASDVYALGLVAYEMLVGRLPFTGGSAADYMMAKSQRPLRSMRNVAPTRNVPEAVEDLVARMLARRFQDRPTIEQIHHELQTGLCSMRSSLGRARPRRPPPLPTRGATAGPPSTKPVTLTTLGATPAAHRRSRRKMLLAAATLALVTLGFRSLLRRTSNAPPASMPMTTNAVLPAPITATTSFTLRIESIPSGASVAEGTTFFGETPVEIPIESASYTPRTFRLSMSGRPDVTFTQVTMTSNVTRIVAFGPEKSTTPPIARPPSIPSLDIRRRR